ncbi:MAG TPA: hypothetical protein VF989_16135, partial [Polyangiaceae bacterium]
SAKAVSRIWWVVSTPQWRRITSSQCWAVNLTLGKLEMKCVSSGNRIVRFGNPTFVEGSGSCQGADPAPAGSAVAQDPITICCRD